jgi:anti-sigma factor ChrR (cupin superfamily)
MTTLPQPLSDAIDVVVGGRDPDARHALVARLRAEPDLAREVEALEHTLAPMAVRGGHATPPPHLLARIEAALDAETAIDTYATNSRLEQGEWQAVRPGVWRKRLWDDRTWLGRVEPGHAFPPHHHDQVEHCLVLAGSMVVDGVEFGPGDYHAPVAGSDHGTISTPVGLLLLIRRGD